MRKSRMQRVIYWVLVDMERIEEGKDDFKEPTDCRTTGVWD